MAFSNASTRVDAVTVDQDHGMAPTSGVPTLIKRPHANDEEEEQQKESHAKIARMETELKSKEQLGRIKELKLEKWALQAELREHKALAEHNLLKANVAKMEQDQQQKDNVSVAQFNAILARIGELEKGKESDQKAILESIGRMERAQQQQMISFGQQMDTLKDQIGKCGVAQTELCANIDQFEEKQTADFKQLKNTYDTSSFLPPNSWDANACHNDLKITGQKCLGVHYKEENHSRSVFAKHSILSSDPDIFYFEVKVENVKEGVAIGLATKAMLSDEWVGYCEDSYGYESDGNFWINNSLKGGKPTYSAGDVVGCGVILATRQLIFTKNGQRLDYLRTEFSVPLALSPSFSTWFDEIVDTCYNANRLSDQRRLSIEHFVVELQREFRVETGNDSLQLEMFGSVLSGFGSKNCDIDLCLTNTGLANNKNDVITKEERLQWLNKLIRYLLKNKRFTIKKVYGARIPIVKFDRHGEFNGDICVENRLAVYATQLLRVYSDFDVRVPPLGFAIKRWAELYDIKEASAGSISSYAYIVMLIHFLQRAKPPVLPFLQQAQEEHMVEGCSVSFDRHPEPISAKNTQSAAQLFFSFLRFYAFQFDMRTDVAQIRTSSPYDKQTRERQKGYTNDKRFSLCVEDPFDNEFTLARGVREKTLHHIVRCFQSAVRGIARFDQEHFATEEEGGDEGVATMSFDQLMEPFNPCRVVNLIDDNTNN